MPFGLQRPEASFAMNFVVAIPTEQVIPSLASTFARISFAIVRPSPSRRLAPVTSRNASSSESGSTSGVTDLKISIMCVETSE